MFGAGFWGEAGESMISQGLSGGLNSIFGGITAARNWRYYKKQAALNYKYNEKAAENAYNRQIDFWNKNNEYNTPGAERERLEAAGINAASAYSNGASSQAVGSVDSPQGNGPSGGSFNPGNGVGGDPVALAQARLMNAQASEIENRTPTPEQGSEYNELTLELMREGVIDRKLGNKILQVTADNAEDMARLSKEQLSKQVDLLTHTISEVQERVISLQNENSLFGERKEQLQKQIQLLDKQILLTAAEEALRRSQKHLTGWQAKEIKRAYDEAEYRFNAEKPYIETEEFRKSYRSEKESNMLGYYSQFYNDIVDAFVGNSQAIRRINEFTAEHPWFSTLGEATVKAVGVAAGMALK